MNWDLADSVCDIICFRDARDWRQFHTQRNLAAAITIEAGELLETFLWGREGNGAEWEIADIAIYLLTFCHDAGIDLPTVIDQKIRQNEQRYTVARYRGNAGKAPHD